MRNIIRILVTLGLAAGALIPSTPARAQTFLGNYTGHEVSGRTVTVHAGASSVRFIFYRPDLVRVDLLPVSPTVFDSSLAVVADTTESVTLALGFGTDSFAIASDSLRIHLTKEPLRFSVRTPEGRVLLEEPLTGGLGYLGEERVARFNLRAEDHFYGTGERGISLDLRGQAFDLYNTAAIGYGAAPATMGVNVSFVASTAGYGLFFDTSYPIRFDLGAQSSTRSRFSLYEDELSFFVIAGATVAEQLEGYTWLTGRQPLPPLWSLGYIQSKFGYRNENELRSIARTMREHHIPCDAVVIDLDWFRDMGDLAWNSSAWPDPRDMVQDLLDDGLRTIVITEPYVTQPSPNYTTATRRGYFGRRPDGSPYVLSGWWSCGCDAALLDLTNPEVRSWWWGRHLDALSTGVAGLWTDLGEPERHPWDMRHHLGSTAKAHNVYNLLWARAIQEGYAADRPGQRLFNLTRAGSAGIQRYGVQPWSGDVSRSFAGLETQVDLLLNMGMSGLGYFHSDIGGFCCGTTTGELYARWMQFGAFCPVTRAHGTGQPTEPWAFGTQVERVCREFIGLRYRLLPYLYTLARENHETGMPLARPLFFADPTDPTLRNHRDSFLLGDALLVSPVTREGQRQKNVRLPRGGWIDFWTDTRWEGDTTLSVAAPLESMPLFVRSGSLLPTRPLVEHTGQLPADTLIVWCYPEEGVSRAFDLYEDDGTSRDYETGAFSRTSLTQTVQGAGAERSLELVAGPGRGTYVGAPVRRILRYEVHGMPQAPRTVTVNGDPLLLASTRGEVEQTTNRFFFDETARRLIVQIEAREGDERRLRAEGIGPPFGEAEEYPASEYSLRQNFPNPVAASTRIHYSLRVAGEVELAVYDIQGRLVHSRFRQDVSPGDHVEDLTLTDLGARAVTSGIYFYTVRAWGAVDGERGPLLFEDSRKMTILR